MPKSSVTSSMEDIEMGCMGIRKERWGWPQKHQSIPQNLEPEKAKDNYSIDGTCFQPCEMHDHWKTESKPPPYLAHVKKLSTHWKSLHQLAMFMEAGTTPKSRWPLPKPEPGNERPEDRDERLKFNEQCLMDREERLARTNVTFIEYQPEEAPVSISIKDCTELGSRLKQLKPGKSAQTPLRLFIVQDLSRDVIELLGARFDIDPLFFREHIHDYVWLNMRDSWAMPPSLASSTRRRSWFQLRNVRLRYHTTEASYKDARKEAEKWNVQRRPDNDRNHWAHNDEVGEVVEKNIKTQEDEKKETKAVVSILRTKTTIWVGRDRKCGDSTVGIVLLDPTLKQGRPLWYDRPNWLPTTSMPESPEYPEPMHPPESTQPPEPIRPGAGATWYEDIVAKTEAYPWFEAASGHKIGPQVLALPTLYTICAEWLIVCDYVRARLSQIEWEIEMPEVFRKEDPNDKRSKSEIIADSLKRLHTWRRHIPVFRDMVNEAIQLALPAAARLTTSPSSSTEDVMEEMKPDFDLILNNIKALQERVDRLTTVVTSEINIVDSKQSIEDNHNLTRLTWLAAIFIPMSFVSTLFSMNESVAALKYTYGWFFLTAIPFTAVCLLFVQMSGGGKVGQKASESDSFYKKYVKFK